MSDLDQVKKNLEEAVERVKESEITAEVVNAAHEMKDDAIIMMDKVRGAVMTDEGKLDKENISRMANDASKTVVDTFEKAKDTLLTEENKENLSRMATDASKTVSAAYEKAKETLLTDENKENLTRMADSAIGKAEDLAGKLKGFFKK